MLLSVSLPARAHDDAGLAAGPGRETVVQRCGLCHSVKNILATGKQTATFWRETVKDMYYEAAVPLDKDSEVIINYLVATFGKPEDAAPTSAPSAAVRPASVQSAGTPNDLNAAVERSLE